MQLEEPIDSIKHPHISPICLPPNEENLVGKNATVTGWGRLSEGRSRICVFFFASFDFVNFLFQKFIYNKRIFGIKVPLVANKVLHKQS